MKTEPIERSYNRLATKTLLVMRLTAVLLTVAVLQVSANAVSQTVNFSGTNVSLKQIFSVIREQTGYFVMYPDAALEGKKPVTVHANDLPIEKFLEKILAGQGLNFSIRKKTIFIREMEPAPVVGGARPADNDQETPLSLPVRIRVVDEQGKPLAGATVTNRKDKSPKVTDDNGICVITADIGNKIEITYVGFTAQTVTIKTLNTTVTVVMKPNSVLDEAVVNVGYQKIKQKYLTGSVTSLKMDSIMQPGLTTVDKMLEGRVPGMIYMQNSGQAGAAPKLRIRGTNTYLGSREPLWVVDGVIRTNPFPIPPERINDPDFVNLLGNAVSGLNPFDIEQIDVLKDATATALYGVRAANGVIVITTKRGKPGPPTVNYNVTNSITQRPRYTDNAIYMMNSKERVDVSREMIEKNLTFRTSAFEAYERAILDYYAGYTDYATFQKMVSKAETVNTDWLRATMRNAFTTNHSFNISGGTHSVTYLAAFGYKSEPGVIKKEQNELVTGRFKLQLNQRKLQAVMELDLSRDKRRYTPFDIGLLDYVYGTSRAIPLYNEDGSYYKYSVVDNARSHSRDGVFKTLNILHEMENTGESIQANTQVISLNINYEILKGFQFRSTLSYTNGDAIRSVHFTENSNYIWMNRGIFAMPNTPAYNATQDMIPFGGELRQETNRRQNYLISSRLNFSRHLDKAQYHQLTMEAAADIMSNRNSGLNKTERGYLRDRGHAFAYVDLTKYTNYASWLANNIPVITEGIQNSFRPFLTGTYIYRDRYIFSVVSSQELSNAFGNRSNEKILPTWSVSGRWNMHEDILSKVKWVDRLALVASFGSKGNMVDGENPNAIITRGAFDTYYNEDASKLKSFPNPDLAWEMVRDYNGHVEFSLLRGRINGQIGYFFSRTTNAFLTKKVSNINGVTSYKVNGGTLENQGVELQLSFKVLDNGVRGRNGLMWRFEPNLGQALNKLINTSLNSRNVVVDDASITYANYLDGSVPINGKAVNTFYSYQFKGLDPQTGIPVFYHLEPENKDALRAKYNAMTRNEVLEAILVESGRREPVLQGAFSNYFSYKGFSLSFTFSYSLGNMIRLMKIASGNYGTYAPSSQQNLRKEFVNRWRYPGDEAHTNIPGIHGVVSPQDYDKLGWFNDVHNTLVTPVGESYFQMYDHSDLRVVKGDYLKLQYVSLIYRFDEKLCKMFFCKGAYVGLSGNNLFTIANKALKGQDPSQSGSAPHINLSIRPIYTLNLNVSF